MNTGKPQRIGLSALLATVAVLAILRVILYFPPGAAERKANTNVTPLAGELSSEEFARERDLLLKMMEQQNPGFALQQLRQRLPTDTALLRSCHALVHEIGHAAYARYGSFGEAMKFQDEICNSGYLHGVIESYFAETPNVPAVLRSVCRNYPPEKFFSWECHHGIGHGLMYYTDNDLPKSLALCETLDSDFARSACVNGIFMENFNTDQKLHWSAFLRPDDPFYPCADQLPVHRAHCYLYAPTYYLALHQHDYAAALNWCRSAAPNFRSMCALGVGSQAIKENINDPRFVEQLCTDAQPSQTAPCIEGMVGLYINHYGALEPAKLLCGQLEPANRETCERTIGGNASLFK